MFREIWHQVLPGAGAWDVPKRTLLAEAVSVLAENTNACLLSNWLPGKAGGCYGCTGTTVLTPSSGFWVLDNGMAVQGGMVLLGKAASLSCARRMRVLQYKTLNWCGFLLILSPGNLGLLGSGWPSFSLIEFQISVWCLKC